MVGVPAIPDPVTPLSKLGGSGAPSAALGEAAKLLLGVTMHLRDFFVAGFAAAVGAGAKEGSPVSGFSVPCQSLPMVRAALNGMPVVAKPITAVRKVNAVDGRLQYRLEQTNFTWYLESFDAARAFFPFAQCVYNTLNSGNLLGILAFIAIVTVPFVIGSVDFDLVSTSGYPCVEISLAVTLPFQAQSSTLALAAQTGAQDVKFFCVKIVEIDGKKFHEGVRLVAPGEDSVAVMSAAKVHEIAPGVKIFGIKATLPARILKYKNLPTVHVKAGTCIDTGECPLVTASVKMRVVNVVEESGYVLC